MRRLQEHETLVSRVAAYYEALTRAAQLIDFATDRQINPKDYEGQIKEMLHAHQEWIEKERERGLFPAFPGTKRPVARPRRKSAL